MTSKADSKDGPTALSIGHRVAALDGLRAIAVGLVLLNHTLPESWFPAHTFGPGNTGVRLFFVLSGYLITGILLSSRREAEAMSQPQHQVWLAFYLRRALRIFPLAYAVLLVAYLAGADGVREHTWVYALYLENWWIARDLAGHWGTTHFWSLAVEEQFYLVWPLLMLWLPRRTLFGVTLSIVVGAAVLRVALGPYSLEAYMWTPARMDALAWGALLAQTSWSSWLGLAAVPLVSFTATAELGMVIVSGAVIQVAVNGPAWVRQALTVKPLVYIGTISYGVYVLHWLIVVALPMLPAPGAARLIIVSTLTILVASVSWQVFERPLNDLKRFVPYVRRPLSPQPNIAGTTVISPRRTSVS